MEFDQALHEAIALNETVSTAGIDAAFRSLASAMALFRQEGYDVAQLIPGGQANALGFSLHTLTPDAFFKAYARLLRKSLCSPSGEFNKLMRSGVSASVGSVLTAIVTTYGLPDIALGVVVPIAVIIMNTGLEAFCAATENPNVPENPT